MNSCKARIEKLEGKPHKPLVRFVRSTRSLEEAREEFEGNHSIVMLDFYKTKVDRSGKLHVTLHEFRRVRGKDGTLETEERAFPVRPEQDN
jgi:hypothetical protein